MKKWGFEWFRGTLPSYFGVAIFLFTGSTKVKSKFWHIGRLCFGYTIQYSNEPTHGYTIHYSNEPTQYATRVPLSGTDADHCPCDSCEVYREFLVKTYGKEVYVAHNLDIFNPDPGGSVDMYKRTKGEAEGDSYGV